MSDWDKLHWQRDFISREEWEMSDEEYHAWQRANEAPTVYASVVGVDTASQYMTATLIFDPPRYSLDDNGSVFWPPDAAWLTDWPEEWPHVCEAWEKYRDEGEHRKIMDRREQVQCSLCGEQMPKRLAAHHGRKQHGDRMLKGESIPFAWANPRWIWDMLGFDDEWWGKPTGWHTLLDARTARNRQWEYDVCELGTAIADEFWRGASS